MTGAGGDESCTLRCVSEAFRIKVCGITSEDAARAAVEAGADHLGIVLCASVRQVSPERAEELTRRVPAAWVGVFADASLEEMSDLVCRLDLTALQLHGRETPDICRAVRDSTGLPVWKAIGPTLRGRSAGYRKVADALLLDAGKGGSGKTLDWEAVGAEFPRSRRRIPLLVAGGLDAHNVALAIRSADPDGVDASSRLERAPGVKDPDRVRAFVLRARAAAETLRRATGAAR